MNIKNICCTEPIRIIKIIIVKVLGKLLLAFEVLLVVVVLVVVEVVVVVVVGPGLRVGLNWSV